MCDIRDVIFSDPLNSEFPLVGIKKPRRPQSSRKPDPGNKRDEYCKTAFYNEQVLPILQRRAVEMEDAKR